MAHFRSGTLLALAAISLLGACAAAPTPAPAVASHSILQSSIPADGSVVRGSVNSLELRFSPPARLNELTVAGSDGLTMPVMVTAVGEVASYSIPLPGLGPGGYAVDWRASSAGTEHRGTIRFTVR